MEELTIRIPPGAVHVQSATCPAGCSLMAPDLPIGKFPSIRVQAVFGSTRGLLHLDPAYGCFDHRTELEIPAGTVVDLQCPSCGKSLAIEDRCTDCGAPMFRMSLRTGGLVEGCLRMGCRQHRLEVTDVDGDLQRLYEHDQRFIL